MGNNESEKPMSKKSIAAIRFYFSSKKCIFVPLKKGRVVQRIEQVFPKH